MSVMVVYIAGFYNRVMIFLACQSQLTMERLANGPLRKVLGMMMQWMDRLASAKRARYAMPMLQAGDLTDGPFAGILKSLSGLQAARVMTVLNDYFRHMTHAITQHHERVAEFVGDCLLALFGALEPNP